MSSILSDKRFHDEKAAYAYVESRVWPEGPVCPHCGCMERVGKLEGKSTRIGVYKCYECRKPFTVKVGTIFEDSHVKLHIWLQAIHLMCASKKGISSNQLHRTLGVTLKTAWFMSHRIREAMAPHGMLPPLGGEGKTVEVDETYIGNKGKQAPGARGWSHKEKVLSLVERGGKVRSTHVQHVNAETLRPILNEQIAAESRLMTDEARVYSPLGKDFAAHDIVNHSINEYVRGDAHTNTIEGYFSIFKRGMKGVYQHCSGRHLKRYLAEYDFRYNEREALGVNDLDRADTALKGIIGKRLTYETANKEARA
ncbi:MAG: IS1595 family transposase [Pseudomonadota bacterium]